MTIDCTQFDPMHCSIFWALKSLKLILPFLLGLFIGYKIKKRKDLLEGGNE